MKSLALKHAKLFFLSIGKTNAKRIKRKDAELWLDHMKTDHQHYQTSLSMNTWACLSVS